MKREDVSAIVFDIGAFLVNEKKLIILISAKLNGERDWNASINWLFVETAREVFCEDNKTVISLLCVGRTPEDPKGSYSFRGG